MCLCLTKSLGLKLISHLPPGLPTLGVGRGEKLETEDSLFDCLPGYELAFE